MIKVLLADSDRAFRTGIRTVLETSGGFDVVGEAETGRQALEMENTLAPDILLLDMELLDLQGSAVTTSIVARGSAARILARSGHTGMAQLLAALDAGVHGYASKDESIDTLVQALILVAAGNVFLSPTISLSIWNWRGQIGTARATPGEACDTLFRLGVTPRLLEILQAVADGQDDEAIATAVNLSVFTVRNHVTHLRELLAIPTRISLVAWCWRSGIHDVSSDDYASWYSLRCAQ